MEIMIDDRIFSADPSDPFRAELMSIVSRAGADAEFIEMKMRGAAHRAEFIAVAGLALAAIATVTSVVSLVWKRREVVSNRNFIDEVESYLRVRGAKEIRFLSSNNLENLHDMSGKPCQVVFLDSNDKPLSLYFGVKGRRLWVSADEVAWRGLID